MVSKFFNQSKPIHFVVVSVLLLIIFTVAKYNAVQDELNALVFSKQVLLFGVSLFSVFVLDFFVSKNNLTRKNSFKILLFVLFIAIIPETILNSKTLVANLFILFAIRRIISLRSKKAVKKKLFDASFWITIAALFYFWSILFFGLIIAALVVFAIVDIKNWIIPVTGFATVLIILTSYMILTEQDVLMFFENLVSVSFDFSLLNSKHIIIGATILFSFGLWSLFYYLKNLRTQTKNLRPSFSLVIVTIIIGLTIIVLSPLKDGSEFIFIFAPLSIIITNYLEVVSDRWFKEVILWVFILAPGAMLLL